MNKVTLWQLNLPEGDDKGPDAPFECFEGTQHGGVTDMKVLLGSTRLSAAEKVLILAWDVLRRLWRLVAMSACSPRPRRDHTLSIKSRKTSLLAVRSLVFALINASVDPFLPFIKISTRDK